MKTNTSVDMEKIKEQIKQELVAEMRMQNMQMQRWCCQLMVLSPMFNRTSPSPATEEQLCIRRCRFDRWHYKVGDGGAL
jgi:DNA-directed RNA polymerase subunit N (RpoN/RPB10)